MNLFNSQDQRHYSSQSKHNKKRLTQDQVSLLETCFDSNKKLEPERKLRLARELGIPPRQIAIWYQNKRARWKTQSLELDYNELRLNLEAALADKRRLERDVQHLRGELEKAREMLFGLNQAAAAAVVSPPAVSSLSRSLSSCGDQERWSSSMHDQDHHHVISYSTTTTTTNWVSDDHVEESLKIEELYACLMGINESSHCG
ncbi:homeobox-leucine zipper protein ATHB-52 [Cornus florida]|uniref:homeobox-leucine zipper protein ATHB-52 n=1 Tax=Cornus florida TaxID=4283 RepID=UPI00289A5BDA|nr:homeobox-leucine zipper protein ATHB-52 [Cornus florida]